MCLRLSTTMVLRLDEAIPIKYTPTHKNGVYAYNSHKIKKNGVFVRRMPQVTAYDLYAVHNIIRYGYASQSPKHRKIYAYTPLSKVVIL